MSLFSQTVVLYLVVGLGMAGAVYLSESAARTTERWFRVLVAIVCWPIFLPVLLTTRAPAPRPADSPPLEAMPDDMTAAIRQVDAELEAALGSLDGWAEDVLARERDRIHELRLAWTAQADRIREMDRLLLLPEYAETFVVDDWPPASVSPLSELGSRDRPTPADRLQASRQARRQNIDRLRRIRSRAYDDLMGTLAWVRELVSMIHLAKFTGAPAARAEELVAQIAAAVEGLSEVTWQEQPTVSAGGNT
jgi:hypothetical protein